MTKRKLIKHLAVREYLPWSGLLASWILIALTNGIETATNLASAILLLGAVRSLSHIDLRSPARDGLGAAAAPPSLAQSLTAVMASLFIGMAGIAVAYGFLIAVSRPVIAQMLLLIAIGLPARYLVAFAGRPPRRIVKFRLAFAFSGLTLVGVAVTFGWGWEGVALALGLREWFAFAVLALSHAPSARPAESEGAPDAAGPWASIVEANRRRAKRRLTMRLSKALLGPVLGPFAGLAARTGRGTGLHRRIENRIPDNRWGLLLVSVVLFAVGATLLVASADVWPGLIACSLLRVGCATAAALIWSEVGVNRPAGPPAR